MLGSTRIKTEIPGPRSRALMERRKSAVSAGVLTATPIFVQEAHGALLTDVDGNTFIDFAGGIGVMNVGHTDARVVEGVKAQAEKLTHTCFAVNHYEPYVELAEKLNALVPGDFEKRSMFVNSGAEAVENAVKTARYYTGRDAILVFENAFHGRTLLTSTMTSKVDPYKKGFGTAAPEVYRVPAPYSYRCPAYQDCSGGCRGTCFDFVERAFIGGVDPKALAAIVIEPISGEGGFIPVPDFYLRRLPEVCDEHGIVLIADEVQSGFGRTGKMLAIEHSSVIPDSMTTAKSIAGGLPLGGVTARAEIMDSGRPGGLCRTFRGNPLAVTAALAVLETYGEENVLHKAAKLGERVTAAMEEMKGRYDAIGEVRGLGAMNAMELVADRETRAPDKARAAKVVEHALGEGLMLVTAGQYGNVIRTLMPLVISDESLEEGLAILDRAMAASEDTAEKPRTEKRGVGTT